MKISNIFYKDKVEDYNNIIYVLDFLLQLSVGYMNKDLIEKKNLDIELYSILNRPNINQEIIHLGLCGFTNDNEKINEDYLNFIRYVRLYIFYDLPNSNILNSVLDNTQNSDILYKNITEIRKKILDYLSSKKVISDLEYDKLLQHKIKKY